MFKIIQTTKGQRVAVHPLVILFWCGLTAALILIVAVFVSGQTFGQRAAQKYLWGTPEWEQEVERLSSGG